VNRGKGRTGFVPWQAHQNLNRNTTTHDFAVRSFAAQKARASG
jgi:hypothetical protein